LVEVLGLDRRLTGGLESPALVSGNPDSTGISARDLVVVEARAFNARSSCRWATRGATPTACRAHDRRGDVQTWRRPWHRYIGMLFVPDQSDGFILPVVSRERETTGVREDALARSQIESTVWATVGMLPADDCLPV